MSETAITVDDQDPGFSLSMYGWIGKTQEEAYNGYCYHDVTSGADQDTVWARWSPSFASPGRYEVYIWCFSGDHPTAANIDITHSSGIRSTTISQVCPEPRWAFIGSYEFSAGTQGAVTITAESPGFTVADAVKFVPYMEDASVSDKVESEDGA